MVDMPRKRFGMYGKPTSNSKKSDRLVFDNKTIPIFVGKSIIKI